MINYHPQVELLQAFVQGELSASLAAGVAIHAELCSRCRQQIDMLTEQYAQQCFAAENGQHDAAVEQAKSIDFAVQDDELADLFSEMLNDITASDAISENQQPSPQTVLFAGQQYQLPRAISNIPQGKITQLGKLSRSRLQLNEGDVRTSLLHIEPGGSVPEHTHKGFELTLLLSGSFSDDQGHYQAGDFIMRDQNHQHQPFSEQGCLCYTVVNDALHFTKGLNRLLNPIGNLIY